MNRIDLTHDGLDFVEILGGLLEVADAHGVFADIWLLAAEHGTAQIVDGMFLAMVEDGHVHLLAAANGKIQFHVFWRESVFVDQGTNDPLSDQLLLRFLDLLAGNVVERVARRDSVPHLRTLLSAHMQTP